VLPQVLQLIGLGIGAQWATRVGGFVLMFLFITLGLAALYRWGPSRRVAQWRWITPGALLATIVTMAASGLFTWYVASFGSYNATYGSLGAIFGFMTWLWITSAVVLVGAELNAETEHQTRQDTTVGHPRAARGKGCGYGRHGWTSLWCIIIEHEQRTRSKGSHKRTCILRPPCAARYSLVDSTAKGSAIFRLMPCPCGSIAYRGRWRAG
jgi:hypothetical protein